MVVLREVLELFWAKATKISSVVFGHGCDVRVEAHVSQEVGRGVLGLGYRTAQEREVTVLIHEQLVALLGQGCVRLRKRLLLRPETSVLGVQGVDRG